MPSERQVNLAVLIDADNISSKAIGGLMVEIANYGTASVRRIYGDWTTPNLGPWKAHILQHSIQPIQQFAYTSGKNSTDGAMIIDAMDLLYTGRFSGFCIVSSDSDFTRLAARIREQGVTVYGFGERKTPSPFIAACTKFVYLDVLSSATAETLAGAESGPRSSATQLREPSPGVGTSWISLVHRPLVGHHFGVRPLDSEALVGIAKAITACAGYEDDYANLAPVGQHLTRISPDLNPRNYGYDRLRDFVQALGIVETKMKTMGDKPPIAMVRLKDGLPLTERLRG